MPLLKSNSLLSAPTIFLVFYDSAFTESHSLSFSAPTISLFLCYAPAQRVTLSFLAQTFFLVFYDTRLHREPFSLFFGTNHFLVFVLCACAESDFLFFSTDHFPCFL
jgi:hypothetical protein